MSPTGALAVEAGDLDTGFAGDGRQTTDFVGSADGGRAVVIQPDGKAVVVGHASVESGNEDFAIARYRTDGTLDTSFSGDGRVTTDFGGRDEANAVVLQADGKIVVAGSTDSGGSGSDGSGRNFALARLNPNGTLDPTFAFDGKVTTDFNGRFDRANAVALQADGKIVAAGASFPSTPAEPIDDFALARYNQNGTLDGDFSGDGRVRTDFDGSFDEANAVAITEDIGPDKIVLAGYVEDAAGDDGFGLARYTLSGTLDTGFSGDGKVMTTFAGGGGAAFAVAIQPADGRVVAAGRASGDFALARYGTGGTLDTSFSGDGKLTTDFGAPGGDVARALVVQPGTPVFPAGKIVAAGAAGGGGAPADFALARYSPIGTLDAGGFSGDGKVTTDFDGGVDSAGGVALGPNRRIVVAGVAEGDGFSDDFAIARYHGVDDPPPDTIIDSGPPAQTNDATPTFAFHSTEAGSSSACAIDTGAFLACGSPYTAVPLADGAHSFSVRATDSIGQTDSSPAERSFVVDTEPPQTTITTGPEGKVTTRRRKVAVEFEFTASDPPAQLSGFECKLNARELKSCESPAKLTVRARRRAREHIFRVRAIDLAGNADPTPARQRFTVVRR